MNYTVQHGRRSLTTTVDQNRTPNAANQISTASRRPPARRLVTPTYDLAGNMTTMPQPGNEAAGLTCQYDAWNRLITVSNGRTIDMSRTFTMAWTTDRDPERLRRRRPAGGDHDYYYAGRAVVGDPTVSPLPPGEGQGVRARRSTR